MASSKSSWRDDDVVNHWRRVREIGMEEGLRQIGCSQYLISEVFNFGGKKHFFGWSSLMKKLGNDVSETVRATILATVGRRESITKKIDLDNQTLTERELIAFCVNISSNTKIVTLALGGDDPSGEPSALHTVEGCTALGKALASNCTVNNLSLRPALLNTEAGRFLFDGLRSNKTLKELHLHTEFLTATGVRPVAEFLSSNSVLERLYMSLDLDYEAAELMSSALSRNTNLQKMLFTIRQCQSDSLAKLLQPFLGQARDDTASSRDLTNSTITLLDLDLDKATGYGLESVVQMIRSNRSLSHLLLRISLTPQEWKKQIFPALKMNETILVILLFGSKGLDGDDVFEALMDVLQNTESKTRLETVDLYSTALESKQAQVDEELRINKQYQYALRGQKSEPTTFGRLVMCGFQYAGKTTLCEAMQRIDSGITGNHYSKIKWKRFLQTCPSLGHFLFGEDAYMELQKRTRGCDIVLLKKQNHLKAIWDFAGQKEFYALHNYLFPDAKNSCFLYVCSCRTSPTKENPTGKIKDMNEIRDECVYWLKFIASNSKPYFIRGGQGQQLPTVIFVLTKADILDDGDARVSQGWAKNVVYELQEKFKDVFNLCDEVKVVNGLQKEDVSISMLLKVVSDQLDKTLKHQTEYNLCRDIRDIFYRWSSENPLNPILDIQDFNKLCKQQFFPLEEVPPGSVEKWEVVLTYFDDIGEIIFPKGLSFIVTNPRWFGVGILGYLIDTFKGVHKSNGRFCCSSFPKSGCQGSILAGVYPDESVVESSRMEVLLENSLQTMHLEQSVKAEQLIELMSKLEMCFKLDEGSENSRLFVPALFDNAQESAARGERQLAWKMPLKGSLTYLGRRLQIENEYTTFLSPGFFPRLQVHLRNYFHKKSWTQNHAFRVERNLIRFSEGGVEVCVEYSGSTGFFVDILVQSQKSYKKALKFVEDEVIYTIRRFCASPQGCQGVTLVEAVIRPYCVEGLHMCKDRKAHSVLVSELEGKLGAKGRDSIHTWSEELEDASPTDYVLDLLEGAGAYQPSITREMAPRLEGSRSRGIRKLSKVELPKHFYPSIEGFNFLSKLNAALNVSKVLPIRLHILCDYTNCPHKVTGQPGREFQLNWTNGGYHLSIAKVAVSLLWTAVGVGTSVAGIPHVGFSNVDNWIETAFGVEGMHTLDAETLNRMNNPGKAMEKVLEEDILKALGKYWQFDPHTQDMKEFLKLEDGKGFWEDFQLRKVVYITDPNQNTRWVCKTHFEEGLERKRLQSTPH